MTEKRFSSRFYEDTGRTITDNNEELSQNEVVDLLNELYEEKEYWKQQAEKRFERIRELEEMME